MIADTFSSSLRLPMLPLLHPCKTHLHAIQTARPLFTHDLRPPVIFPDILPVLVAQHAASDRPASLHCATLRLAWRSAVAQDWTKIYSTLGLAKSTLSELSAFRARHSAALNRHAALTSSAPEIDLAKYKSVLKDQRAVDEAEKVLKSFKPQTYDVKKWQQAVEAFEGKAVSARPSEARPSRAERGEAE